MKEGSIIFSGPMVRGILEDRKTKTRRIVKPQPPVQPRIYESLSDGEKRWGYPDGMTAPRGDITYASGITRPLAIGLCKTFRCPYGQPGDRLWVRETWMPFERAETMQSVNGGPLLSTGRFLPGGIGYRADLDNCGLVPVTGDGLTVLRTPKDRWRPSIHMPRRASRLTLEVCSIRVERLHEIREEDAIAEGIFDGTYDPGLADGGKPGWCYAPNSYAGTPRHGFELLWRPGRELSGSSGLWRPGRNGRRKAGRSTKPWAYSRGSKSEQARTNRRRAQPRHGRSVRHPRYGEPSGIQVASDRRGRELRLHRIRQRHNPAIRAWARQNRTEGLPDGPLPSAGDLGAVPSPGTAGLSVGAPAALSRRGPRLYDPRMEDHVDRAPPPRHSRLESPWPMV